MKHRRVTIHLAWMALLLVAVTGAIASGGGTMGTVARDVAATDSPAAAVTPIGTDDFTPAACRKEPQCSTDLDCVAFCGPSGGHCVHSSCPIRICKCS